LRDSQLLLVCSSGADLGVEIMVNVLLTSGTTALEEILFTQMLTPFCAAHTSTVWTCKFIIIIIIIIIISSRILND